MSDLDTAADGTAARGPRAADDPLSHLVPGTGAESGLGFLPDPLSHDRDGVRALFEEPDFFYQCTHPELLSGEQVDALVGERSYGVVRGSDLAGLYETQPMGAPREGHYLLHLRLTPQTPLEVWVAAYHAAVRRTRLVYDVVRISICAGGHDLRGLKVLRACGFVEEGALNNEVMHRGRLYPEHFFALVWPPEEVAG